MKKCSAKLIIITVVGLIFFIIGIVFCSFWPHSYGIFDGIVHSKLPLRAESWGLKFWDDNHSTLKNVDFYFFNWTNPDELETPGIKPNFVEVGPYRFIEEIRKLNIVFHPENNTVSYDELKSWHFDEKKSIGGLSDKITQLNVPVVAITHQERHSHFNLNSLSMSWKTVGEKLFITKSVNKLLFTGYKGRAIQLVNKGLRKDAPLPDRFGWYYLRNETFTNGHMNMGTGTSSLDDFGIIKNWNYTETTSYYGAECNHVEGSAGEFWPPDHKAGDIKKWMTDLCRPLTYEFTGEAAHNEIPGYKYTIGDKTLNDNECYCNGDCSPKGVINITACHHGYPVFVSLPHFYKGDPTLRDQIVGMDPKEADHSSYIILNPSTGIPLDVASRFQINVLLQTSSTVQLFKKVPTIYFPIFWVDSTSRITENSSKSLTKLLLLPSYILYGLIAFVVVGALILLIVAMIRYSRTQSEILWIAGRDDHSVDERRGRRNVNRITLAQECNYNERLI